MSKNPPPQGCIHKVKDGEWVGSIAMSYGFADWEKSVWQHPKNAKLRERRENPHVLAIGDELFIPPRLQKDESVDTDKKHRFKLKVPNEVLRIHVLGPEGEPLKNEKYELTIHCESGSGVFKQQNTQTDDNGVLTEKIPSSSRNGSLLIPRLEYTIPFDFGYLTPMDLSDESKLIRGAQERLEDIGFDPGPIDGIDGPLTRTAVEAFQRFCQENKEQNGIDAGPVDGVIGEKTRAALQKYYGS
jgi:N-acetylmuramoyl-L-alanine amidase